MVDTHRHRGPLEFDKSGYERKRGKPFLYKKICSDIPCNKKNNFIY